MPQPLSRVNPNASVVINNAGDFPTRRHPELAILALDVIATWATVEAFMLNLFIDLMGGPKDKAATVFLAQDTQSAKTRAITAIAATLSEEHKKLLGAILAIAKTCQKTRDKIAHCIWGDSPNIPDAILLADAKDLLTDFDRSKIFVYKSNDFDDAIRANLRVASFGFDFRWIITEHPANRDNALYERLCAEPEIQEKLNRQASPDQSPPEVSG